MYRLLSLTCLSIITLATSFISAQSLLVYDLYEQKGISGVHVFNNNNFSTTTNQDGICELATDLVATDTLFFQHIAYESEAITIGTIKQQDFKLGLVKADENLPEFVISVGKIKESLNDVSNKVAILDAKEISNLQAQTSADVLQQTGGVYIQKSQMGGGSPVIRGFEANKVLIVVDGVRLNNAIYRGGHVQNVITIDNNVLDRVEVIFGPGSLIYGSGALGGVMHFMTKQPLLATDKPWIVKGNVSTRYATVNQEKNTHLDIGIGRKNFGSLTSITYSDFGHLRIGKNRLHGYEDWGKRPFYVATIAGQDTLLTNNNPNILRHTAYSQLDILQKFYYQPNENIDFTWNFQYSTSSDIPRFDKLNDETDEGLKFAEWYYGPQNRLLGAVSIGIHQATFGYDNINFVVAYQRIGEDRINRKFGQDTRTHREELVNVWSANLDFTKNISPFQTFQYGLETTFNEVTSTAYFTDVLTKEVTDGIASTRYPDGGSTMSTLGAYVRHKWKINPKWTLVDGVRYAHTKLGANFTDTTLFTLPSNKLQDSFGAITGSLSMVYKPMLATKITATLATGFRTPNIDDATKVFDPTDGIVVVPNLNLRPEYAYNMEVGLIQKIREKLTVDANIYGSYLTNVIKRSPFQLGDKDSLSYDGELMATYANVNAGKGYIIGAALGLEWMPISALTISNKINYIRGKDLSNEVPLGHIPPLFGQFLATYKQANWQTIFSIQYNGKKSLSEYSPTGEDKESEAVAEGTPAWYTLNIKGYYQLNKYLKISGGVENILDHHYKPFAAGLSGGGRNFLVGVQASF